LKIFFEATLINILEITLYNRTALESFDNNIDDLLDYIYSKLSKLT